MKVEFESRDRVALKESEENENKEANFGKFMVWIFRYCILHESCGQDLSLKLINKAIPKGNTFDDHFQQYSELIKANSQYNEGLCNPTKLLKENDTLNFEDFSGSKSNYEKIEIVTNSVLKAAETNKPLVFCYAAVTNYVADERKVIIKQDHNIILLFEGTRKRYHRRNKLARQKQLKDGTEISTTLGFYLRYALSRILSKHEDLPAQDRAEVLLKKLVIVSKLGNKYVQIGYERYLIDLQEAVNNITINVKDLCNIDTNTIDLSKESLINRLEETVTALLNIIPEFKKKQEKMRYCIQNGPNGKGKLVVVEIKNGEGEVKKVVLSKLE